jgi:flagellin
MTVINTNIPSLKTQAALAFNTRGLQKAMEELSTGKRINSAADDAAGLTIASSFRGQIKSLGQEVRNANDGISLLQTAEGSTTQVTQMLQRMRELVTQALNGTYSTTDVANMGTEVSALQDEIDRIAGDTLWNGMALLDGTFSGKTVQVSDSSTITLNTGNVKTASLGVDNTVVNFGTATAPLTVSTSWIGLIDKAIASVSTMRAGMGATINRLNYAVDNITNAQTNLSASASRIEDTDYAESSAELAKHQVIQQAATAMLAQANQQPQLVLQLLK